MKTSINISNGCFVYTYNDDIILIYMAFSAELNEYIPIALFNNENIIKL